MRTKRVRIFALTADVRAANRTGAYLAVLCFMDRERTNEGILIGEGALTWGPRRVGPVTYKIHLDAANGQASLVELDRKPPAKGWCIPPSHP